MFAQFVRQLTGTPSGVARCAPTEEPKQAKEQKKAGYFERKRQEKARQEQMMDREQNKFLK